MPDNVDYAAMIADCLAKLRAHRLHCETQPVSEDMSLPQQTDGVLWVWNTTAECCGRGQQVSEYEQVCCGQPDYEQRQEKVLEAAPHVAAWYIAARSFDPAIIPVLIAQLELHAAAEAEYTALAAKLDLLKTGSAPHDYWFREYTEVGGKRDTMRQFTASLHAALTAAGAAWRV